MGGIWVGGYYNNNSSRVPLLVYSTRLMRFCCYDFALYTKHDLKPITGMHLSAPELLAFWSEDD